MIKYLFRRPAYLLLILLTVMLLSSCGMRVDAGTQTRLPENDIYILFTSDVHCAVDEGMNMPIPTVRAG